MANIKQISKLAEHFYSQAISAQTSQIDNILKQISGLTNGAIASLQHLLSLPKYKNHVNFRAMIQQLQNFRNILLVIKQQNNDPTLYLTSLDSILQDISFYTAPSNIGTGRDVATDIKDSGYTEPSYYIDQLQKLLLTLKNSIFSQTHT